MLTYTGKNKVELAVIARQSNMGGYCTLYQLMIMMWEDKEY